MSQSPHILIIDDNPHDRELAIRALKTEFPDAMFVPISAPMEFEQALEAWAFQLVITDYQLRWTTGLEVVRQVKAIDSTCPVIMFTATGNEEVAVEAMKAGIDDYVVKSARHIGRLVLAARAALERSTQIRRTSALEAERQALLVRTQASERRARFLADTGVILAASLDYHVTLKQIANLVVQELGDWCFIDMIGRDGYIRRLAVAHRDPAQAELARQLERYPADPNQPDGITNRILQTGETLLIPVVPADHIDVATEGHAQKLLASLNIHSVIMAGLPARGVILGIISIVSSSPERPYTEDDRQLVEELARRAGLAIDNARLYTGEQHERRRAEQAIQRLTRLQSITSALSEALTPREVAHVIITQGLAALQADAGALYILDDATHTLESLDFVGYDVPNPQQHVRVGLDRHGPLRDAVLTRDLVIVKSAGELIQRWPSLAQSQAVSGDVMTITVPLLSNNQARGALHIAFRALREIELDDQAFVVTLARQCAQALERARLYEAEKHAHAEAEAAVRVRDQFLSVASHELRTPLTSLLGNAELVMRRARRDQMFTERSMHGLEIVINQAKRLSRMVEALLDLTRLEQDRLVLTRQTLDLGVLIRQVAEESHALLDGHTLTVELPDEPLLISGDELRLQQVLHNLIGNAIKYSPTSSNVTVQLQHDGEHAIIRVCDQGVGIPAADQPRLFQRFFRASNVDARHISGMGIGLYVVKEIVALHGGSINVTSHEQNGSEFTVLLPLYNVQPEQRPA